MSSASSSACWLASSMWMPWRGCCGKSAASSIHAARAVDGQSGRMAVAAAQMVSGARRFRRERAAVHRRDSQSLGRLGAIFPLSKHGHAAVVAADRQVRVRGLVRQEFITDEALLDDRQKLERKPGRQANDAPPHP
jgi:hypothetical protein